MPAPPLTILEWLARDLPPPDYLMGHIFSTTTRGLLVAPTGLGKTNFAMALGMHMAAGRDFLHWRAHRPARVLCIDGEMSRRLFRERIDDATRRLGEKPETFFALSHEDIENFAPLNTIEGQQCIERIINGIGGVDFMIPDSVMCLTFGDMRDGEAWAKTMPWVRSLTKRNIGQLWIHHTGHDENKSYGDKTREWQLDTVMHMAKAERPGADVAFTLEFRKARERAPTNRHDFSDVTIALLGDEWTGKHATGQRHRHVSPLGLKFLDALNEAIADSSERYDGRPAANIETWRSVCTTRGLLDDTKADSARSLLSKHKRELIAANRITCNDTLAWVI